MLTLAAVDVRMPLMGMSGMRLERYIRSRWEHEPGGIRGLAEAAGVSSDALYKWFRGDSEPSLDALGRLARVLGVKRYEIVAVYDGDRPPVDLGSLLDPDLRAQLVDLIATEVERQRE